MGNWKGRKCTNVGLHEIGKWKILFLAISLLKKEGKKGVYIEGLVTLSVGG